MNIGDKAPEILGINEKGEEIRLSNYKGKKIVLYFYPKDSTSDCTAQACNLRDNYTDLRKAGYEVIGVSVDNEKSHQKFIEKNNLPFTLIADTDKKLESRVKQCAAHAGRQEELLSYQTLSSASGYLDWILPAFSRNRCFDGLYEQFGLAGNAENPLYAEKIPVTIRLVSPAGLVEGEVLHQMERAVNEQKIMEIPKQPPREAALKELVEERFAYQYPYEKEKQIPVKVTVSQLKKAGMEESEIGKELFAQEELVPIVPGFLKKDHVAALTGSDRGTAYHRLLECLDYRRAYSITELMAQTEELIAEGKMTKEAAECIYFKSILAFAKSPVGMRMRNAFLNETLKREQPFVMSVPASEADPSYPEDETILVQGIIDAWFPEGDEIVLVDYKTDRVKEAGELKKRYEKQLAYYQQALERTTGKKVKEKIIYSLALDEELVL